ncbi:MAG: hypothetical protein AB9834_20135 [Lentimicrobium sp.]
MNTSALDEPGRSSAVQEGFTNNALRLGSTWACRYARQTGSATITQQLIEEVKICDFRFKLFDSLVLQLKYE